MRVFEVGNPRSSVSGRFGPAAGVAPLVADARHFDVAVGDSFELGL